MMYACCMGTCSSCSVANSSSSSPAAVVDGGSSSRRSSTARVIDLHGSLAEFPVPATASQVLLPGSSSSPPCFLCSSDSLFVDAHIPAVAPDEPLRRGQIYFVLPVSMLHYPLSVSDMAALATRASSALTIWKDDDEGKTLGGTLQQQQQRPRRRVIRVRPAAAEVDEATCEVLNQDISALASYGVLPALPTTTTLVPQRSLVKMKKKRPSALHVPTRPMKNKLTTIQEAGE